jgi:hypothetical protein
MTRVSAKKAVNPYATTVYSDQPSVPAAGNCIYKIPQTQWQQAFPAKKLLITLTLFQ